jgi:hypothetical protein
MPDYLTLADLPLLRSKGFEPGFSGESWFGVDSTGMQWQAAAYEKDDRLTFMSTEDRTGVYMDRTTFEELFK